jgi:hypothetical protein
MPIGTPIRRASLMLATLFTVVGVAAEVATDDLPPVGHSRFDELIGDAPVPYPFSHLVARINAQMHIDAGGLPPLKVTLIPLGRSLQRESGAPDFFRLPRVVAAADGDNKAGHAPLKDRLFLGFHEKGAVIEVISYNDAAGRFEFQVVRDYRAGAKPTLFYARRSLCLACHQNAAPIFARPLWDETPANPVIAQKLKAAGRDFYGVKVSGTDIAYFIDNASDRANLFSVWQTLWQQGCGAGEEGDRCRLQAFAAALDYARFGKLPQADSLANTLTTLARNWSRMWPNGLSIPNPDLPNRNPLAALPDPAHDPLRLRPLLEVWRKPDQTAFIVGLSGMLDRSALQRLGKLDVTAALERLLANGGFEAKPFSQAVLYGLIREQGLALYESPLKLPPARVEAVSRAADPLALWRAHCAGCHDTSLSHPPNFLHGSLQQASARLQRCAPRIFVRLSMAEVAEPQRRVAPMPPAAMLASRGISPGHWAKSPELAALKRDIATRLPPGATTRFLAQPYQQLPQCAEAGR